MAHGVPKLTGRDLSPLRSNASDQIHGLFSNFPSGIVGFEAAIGSEQIELPAIDHGKILSLNLSWVSDQASAD
jgi:hypothetical protein